MDLLNQTFVFNDDDDDDDGGDDDEFDDDDDRDDDDDVLHTVLIYLISCQYCKIYSTYLSIYLKKHNGYNYKYSLCFLLNGL